LLYSPNAISHRVFYVYAHQVVEEPNRFVAVNLMVHGYVVAGSITEETNNQTTTRAFFLEYEGQQIRVHHTGAMPPTLRDFARVEARGTLVERDGEYHLDAVELFSSPYYGCWNGPGGGDFPPEQWLSLSEERHSQSLVR
jgi:cytochrome c-type biogenesis protein CcmE